MTNPQSYHLSSVSQTERLKAVYQPSQFGEHAGWLARALTEYLEIAQKSETSTSRPIDMVSFQELARQATAGGNSFERAAQLFLQRTVYLNSPRCMGHQVAPPIPAASLFAAIAAVTNQGNAIHEMSPFATAAERVVVRKLCAKIGWDDASDGVLTNGGSIANLTALLAARNHVEKNSWKRGVAARGVIFCGEGAHYSISRAAGILGLGTQSVVKIRSTPNGKMDSEQLAIAIERAKASGKVPLCIVASAVATSLGVFDNLTAVGKIAGDEGIWLHVDGAHGASALFSKKYGYLVEGIELADSVIWDAHKMMYMPALCAAVLFRDGKRSFETFQQDAPYLFREGHQDLAYFSGGLRTIECTKQSLALPLWGTFAIYGESIFADLVDVTFDLAREFHQLITHSHDFLPVLAPESNIYCFRYVPATMKQVPPERLSIFQAAVR